jgi:hypothetical protein
MKFGIAFRTSIIAYALDETLRETQETRKTRRQRRICPYTPMNTGSSMRHARNHGIRCSFLSQNALLIDRESGLRFCGCRAAWNVGIIRLLTDAPTNKKNGTFPLPVRYTRHR